MTALDLEIGYVPTSDARTKISEEDKETVNIEAARTGRTEAQMLRLVIHAWARKARQAEQEDGS